MAKVRAKGLMKPDDLGGPMVRTVKRHDADKEFEEEMKPIFDEIEESMELQSKATKSTLGSVIRRFGIAILIVAFMVIWSGPDLWSGIWYAF